MNKLFAELRRRKVFRVATVYVVASWILAQAASVLESAVGLPVWFDGMVVILLLLGFPLIVLVAWTVEMGPEGVRRVAPATPEELEAARRPRLVDYAMPGALVLVAAAILATWMLPQRDGIRAGGRADERSIAVLPFTDLSPEGNQAYFADGLSDELLNVLAQSRDLKVAGRTSSFAFRGQDRDLREIGALLNVAYVLEGSVRKAGDTIRVTAQLIEAADGYHVFSETYDGELADIFAVQDDIAGRIAEALRSELGASAEDAAPESLEAYDLYLMAREKIYTRAQPDLEEAERLLDQAIALDPTYAQAYAQRGFAALLLDTLQYGERPVDEAVAMARPFIERALALDPDHAEVQVALAMLMTHSGAVAESVAPLRRALELNPQHADALNLLAIVLVGQNDAAMTLEAIELWERAAEHDPFYTPAFGNLMQYYSMIGRWGDAQRLIDRYEQIGGADARSRTARFTLAMGQGDLSAAAGYLRAMAGPETPESATTVPGLGPLTPGAPVDAGLLAALGELEAALPYANPVLRPALLLSLGRDAEAMEAADAAFGIIPQRGLVLATTLEIYVGAGEPQRALDQLNEVGGGIDAAFAGSPAFASYWLGPAIVAYRRTGDSEGAQYSLELMARSMALAREIGEDGSDYWQREAQLAALQGDTETALGHLRTSIDKGAIGPTGFESVVFDDLRDDPRFVAMETEMRRRLNAERTELGLEPL